MTNNLNKLQEETEKEFIKTYPFLSQGVKFTPNCEEDKYKSVILTEMYRNLTEQIQDFIKQAQLLAYNQGVQDSVEALFKIEIEQDSSDYELAQLRYRKEAINNITKLMQ